MNVKVEKINNGIKLMTVDTQLSTSATVMVLFDIGSRYEDEKNNGVAHLIEHTIFKGTEKRPTSMDIAHEVESMGGYMNAATSYEFTEYYIRVPNENIVDAVDILSDMVMNSKFDKEEIEKEKGVILEEIKMYEDSPKRAVVEMLYEHLWPDSPMGRNIAGTLDTVKNMKREDIMSFINKYYNAENVLFVVCGDLNKLDIKALIDNKFSLPKGISSKIFLPAISNESITLIKNKKVEQSHVCICTYSVDSFNEDFYNLRVANSILGNGFGSFLYQDIREKLGAAYYTYSWVENFMDTGIFCMQAGLENSKLNQGIEMMVNAFNRIKKIDFNDDDLNRAKQLYKGYISMELESSEEMGRWLAHQYLEKGKFDTIEEAKMQIGKVTKDDIKRSMSSEMFNKMHLVMISPIKDEGKFSKILNG